MIEMEDREPVPQHPSMAPPGDVELYNNGFCHVLALALHRRFGWSILVVEDLGETFWQDPEDPDNRICGVPHVLAVDATDMAWDINGARPREHVLDEVAARFNCNRQDLSTDVCGSEAELRHYAGYWAEPGEEPVDRPLTDFDDDDVAAADEAAKTALGILPGFEPVSAPGLI